MQIFHVGTIDSTNEEAKRLLRAGRINHVACVQAREQTAGKGNLGRTWLSPKDAGIYFSVVELAPQKSAPPDTVFTMAAGIACASVLREATGIDVRLKPVNDLVVGNRKLGGILVESLIEDGRIRFVITGIGINTHAVDRAVSGNAAEPVSMQEVMESQDFENLQLEVLIGKLARSVRQWNRLCWLGHRNEIHAAWKEFAIQHTVLPGAPQE